MIVKINRVRVTILKIAKIITTTAVNHGEKSVIFVAKKIIALISIQPIRNKKQKNFKDKTKNFVKIKVNTIHF